MLPNFLVIGAEKSATTWIYNRLKEHPDIFMSNTKEIHFFNKYGSNLNIKDHYKKLGIDWYEDFFKNHNGEKAIGEVTPMYLCDPYAPKRINETFDKVKLITILRNPTDRAYSHYWMAKWKNHTDLTFEEVVNRKTDKFIKRGLYYKQLKRYYKYFDKDNMLIILMDDILKNDKKVLKQIYNFLDVKMDFTPENINNRENSSGKYRSTLLLNFISKLTTFFRCKIKLGFIIDFLKKIGFADFIKNINKKESDYPEMPNHLRKKLIRYYREHNKRLAELIERDLSHWEKQDI